MSQTALPEIDACWRRIGVRGDRSCPELLSYIHCRNCPVHTQAARALLDRPLAAEHRASQSGHFAGRSSLPEAALEKSAFVFRILGEWLALPSAFVREVVDRRALHSLPHRNDPAVLGLVNIRGELVVLVSLKTMLGIGAGDAVAPAKGAPIAFARLLVVGTAEHRIALPVDEAHGILRYTTQDLADVPATMAEARSHSNSVIRWQSRSVGLLDPERLLPRLDRIIA